MSADNRVLFESELLKELKLVASKFEGVTASKNKLKFKYNKKFVAELVFEHLSRVDSYVLVGMVSGGEIFECSSNFTPPYKSNLFNEFCFSFISSSEQNKVFSGSLDGAIKTPSPDSVGQVCAHIKSVLEEFYIPRMLACIVPSERTIKDVLSSPESYAYPAVFIHCAAVLGKNGRLTDLSEAVNSKKIVKNKDYDIPLLSNLA
ncbi:hypothetical protein [Pseudomonas sp. CC120222-01a]|uniref:hypothetical protein n=1 Tax=Pseudomonas sp. CC120222-01a TaxID=1378075 RepID=UPI000D8EE07C|nr:hypothetical protein [Pseudomonas sp. CC120222-01a]PVZ40655.1 hypothetical protein N430_02605 [Pseudomonas sp. CC120222-01a]